MHKIPLAVVMTALAATPALACGPFDSRGTPAIGASIDDVLPETSLDTADRDKVTLLRARIQKLIADGKTTEAQKTEEVAMRIMGYKKLWLRCGFGTFMWMKM